jgi:hypothetical protein
MTTTTATTTEVTDAQIRALRAEATAAGDHRQVDLCNRALADGTIDQDGNEIAFADWSKDEAREQCAEAIAWAKAQA